MCIRDRTFEDAVNRIDAVMQDSIAAHKISDTEGGCFLSSGVDSSYIAAASHCDKTFTVGFANEQYDETSYAKELSEHLSLIHISSKYRCIKKME